MEELLEEEKLASRKEIKEAILKQDSGIVEIRAYAGPGSKRSASPMYDASSNWYRGVDFLSEEQKRTMKTPHVDPEDPENPLSSVELEHNLRFNLSNIIDRLKLKWLLECENSLALSYEEGLMKPMVKHYVYQEDVDIKKKENKFELIDTATQQLRMVAADRLSDIARLLGFNMAGKSNPSIRLFMREKLASKEASIFAKKLIKVLNDKTKDQKLFVYKAIDKKIIKISSNNEYKYGELFLGTSFESTMSTIKDPKNRDVLLSIQEKLDEPFPENTPKSINTEETESKEDELTDKNTTTPTARRGRKSSKTD